MTDYDYVIKRDRLIPKAARKADQEHGKMPRGDRDDWNRSWNVCFLEEMDRLAKEAGLIK